MHLPKQRIPLKVVLIRTTCTLLTPAITERVLGKAIRRAEPVDGFCQQQLVELSSPLTLRDHPSPGLIGHLSNLT
jgi:hypothetical protein